MSLAVGQIGLGRQIFRHPVPAARKWRRARTNEKKDAAAIGKWRRPSQNSRLGLCAVATNECRRDEAYPERGRAGAWTVPCAVGEAPARRARTRARLSARTIESRGAAQATLLETKRPHPSLKGRGREGMRQAGYCDPRARDRRARPASGRGRRWEGCATSERKQRQGGCRRHFRSSTRARSRLS